MMITLDRNWSIRSADGVRQAGNTVSLPSYKTAGWIPAAVPGTVLGALTRAGKVPDMRTGVNIEKIPGFKGGMDLHTLRDMPDDSPYRRGWWFRNVFSMAAPRTGQKTWLLLEGINYRANVWVNGRRVGTDGHVKSQFRSFRLDVTRLVRPGRNCVALEVFAPQFDDFGHTWIDWCPEPPDGSMGIFQPVRLETTGPVVISEPYAATDLDTESLKKAELTVYAVVANTADEPVTAILRVKTGTVTIRKKMHLARRETRRVILPSRTIRNPRIWWPWQLGKQELYTLDLSVSVGRTVSHRLREKFGIRKIESRLNRYGARQFSVNGRDMLLRGTAWAPDVFLEDDPGRDINHLKYLKEMHQNTIRLEGVPVSRRFLELCDREGILIHHGITCVNWWEHSQYWREEDYAVARASVKSLFAVLRNHPSFSCWLMCSDFPCTPAAEEMYLRLIDGFPIGVPVIGNSAKKHTEKLGPTGMLHGPYDFVPPVFWYRGGALHFNTECGPDSCIPEADSLRKMLPEKVQRHPRSAAWARHCGLQLYINTKGSDEALRKRYGITPDDMRAFGRFAQVQSYEGWRAMYEAWARNYPRATGVIGWMFNSAWPSLMWQMIDYYDHPLGAYFGSRKACEPMHVQYSYDDHSVWAINQTAIAIENADVTAKICDLRGTPVWKKTEPAAVRSLGAAKCFTLPRSLKLLPVYFLVLEMSAVKKRLSRNVYWLSSAPDKVTIVAKGDQWTPQKRKNVYADFSALRNIGNKVSVTCTAARQDDFFKLTVDLVNHPDRVAFFVWLKAINRKTGRRIAPAFWSDNGITLMPGEKARITCTLPAAGVRAADVQIKM